MTLHIIKSGQAAAIEQVARIIQEDDQVLLLEDGCYLLTLAMSRLTAVSALSDHMKMRGLISKAEGLGINLISVKDWVLLTRSHQQSTTW